MDADPVRTASRSLELAVVGCVGWTWRERLALMRAAAAWARAGFSCAPQLSVHDLCKTLPVAVRQLLIDPLCVAALNTPATQASATVFLRVLRDALFSGRGSADLLLPRRSLSPLLPTPAQHWLHARGAQLRSGRRVTQLDAAERGWRIDGQTFDAVILACTASEAARLARPHASAWADLAQAMRYEPIVTVYLQCAGARLPAPMMALLDGPDAPAQFVFDHGALGGPMGIFAFVVSGARAWVDLGLEATSQAVLRQAMRAFTAGTWPSAPTVLRVMAEKRATFCCTPGLRRPGAQIAYSLVAAGDYVEGPYPATLEGAVRSGEAALRLLQIPG